MSQAQNEINSLEAQNPDYPVVRDSQNPAYHNSNGLPNFALVAHPLRVTCPHCHKEGDTKVTSKIGLVQWIICLILCLVGCWCYCCIPFCIKDLRDATHTCQHCDAYLGRSQDPSNK